MSHVPKLNTSTDDPVHALEALVVDNPELERLEALLAQFNLFEALGAVRQELRHSDFLAFLLDPRQNHGLGDLFLKRLLQAGLGAVPRETLPITLVDLDVWDLQHARVFREWQSIDILVLDEAHKLVVLIENKIDSGEHSGQLRRYLREVHHAYPNFRRIALYLTPSRELPSVDAYLPLGYDQVCSAVEGLIGSRSSTLGPDVATLMKHYVQMLRRHIVTDSEVADLCQRIYQKHQAAMDLILEHRPDRQAQVAALLRALIEETPGLVFDSGAKGYLRFCCTGWDTALLRTGQGWSKSGRMLMFEFANTAESVRLLLAVGPGPKAVRQRLLAMAEAHTPPFKALPKAIGRLYQQIFVRPIISKKEIESEDAAEIDDRITKRWQAFVADDLPRISRIVEAQDWIYEDPPDRSPEAVNE